MPRLVCEAQIAAPNAARRRGRALRQLPRFLTSRAIPVRRRPVDILAADFLPRALSFLFSLEIRAALIFRRFRSSPAPRQASAPNESHGVRFVLGAAEISPTSTFELRFDQAMVPPQSVGLVAPISPLLITPVLPGSFVWLSQRSGVFTPSEPLALATAYQLRLAANLATPRAGFRRETCGAVQTPPMSIMGVSPSSFREKDAPSSPKIVAAVQCPG